MKKTSILQCPGKVCSPPVVSKCLGEAHRRLELFTLIIYLFRLKPSPPHTVGNLVALALRGGGGGGASTLFKPQL